MDDQRESQSQASQNTSDDSRRESWTDWMPKCINIRLSVHRECVVISPVSINIGSGQPQHLTTIVASSTTMLLTCYTALALTHVCMPTKLGQDDVPQHSGCGRCQPRNCSDVEGCTVKFGKNH